MQTKKYQIGLLLLLVLLTILNGFMLLQYHIEETKVEPTSEATHFIARSWLDLPEVIAHAGGAWRRKDETYTYTNSLESFEQNYQLGHRVFEFDFYPTADDNLALVHDWNGQGNKDGVALTTDEWKNFDMGYTTMVISDLFSLMVKYPDFYVITDTKFADESSRHEFEIIYREAKKIDEKLLDRFVPQIYNDKMYDYIANIYPWKSMIYTVYQTSSPAEDVINFSASKPEIEVITVPMDDPRYDEATIKDVHDKGMLVFNHTPNSYQDFVRLHAIGADGFYTDYLLPRDIELLYSYD